MMNPSLPVRARRLACCLSVATLCLLTLRTIAEEAKSDARYPFRTDFANANLPWYQPKPLEFPPHH